MKDAAAINREDIQSVVFDNSNYPRLVDCLKIWKIILTYFLRRLMKLNYNSPWNMPTGETTLKNLACGDGICVYYVRGLSNFQ